MIKTILDSSSINGLLRMAGEEGLLADREDYGDRFLYGLGKRPLAEWHRQQILEQVILNDRVCHLNKVPLDWLKGDFVHMGLLEESRVEEGNTSCLDRVSPALIEGMLLARGYESDLNKWQRTLADAQLALSAVEEYEARNPRGKADGLSVLLRGAVDQRFRATEYFQLVSRRNLANQEAAPIIRVIEELISLSNYAKRTGCHLRVPLHHPSANLINIPNAEYVGGEATQVFRVTTQQLGLFPICETLREALALAKRPETLSLRAKIAEWVSSINTSSVDVTENIQRDIKHAVTALNTARRMKSAGFLTAIVSIPISAVGIVNPFFGALGLTMTCIGVFLDQSGTSTETNLSWIGFGTTRS